MTIENLVAMFFGYFYGLSFSIVVIIYMRLRERLARLEWSLGIDKKKTREQRRKETKPKEA